MLGDPDGVEAELFGQQQLGHLLAQEARVVDGHVVGEAGGDSDVHGRSSVCAPPVRPKVIAMFLLAPA